MRILAVTNMYPTASAPHSGIFVEQQIKALERIGLEIHLVFVKRLEKGMTCYLGLSRRIRARIQAFKPDLVHVFYGGVMADVVTSAVVATPTIITFHGSDLLGEHLSGKLRQMIAGYGVLASRRAARRASGIVTVSEGLKDALPCDVDIRKVRVIPCGIDLDRFRPLDQDACRKELGWNSNKFHILFPANGGDPVKRLDLAQAAVNALDPSGTRTELHQLRGIANAEVPVWLNASEVLLLTSLHEGSPTVVKEALACNLPIVSVDVGDVRERISNIAGCYLALANARDLAAKLSLVRSSGRLTVSRNQMQSLSLRYIALQLNAFYGDIFRAENSHCRG